jgi:hypothetical protein
MIEPVEISIQEYKRKERDLEGICVNCGATAYCVENDAEDYLCSSCEENQVQGIMSAFSNGLVSVFDVDEVGFL